MEPILEELPLCNDTCVNIDSPYCHCLACLKTGVGLSLWGECIECQSCVICQELCPEISANGRCTKCLDCCNWCYEHSTELMLENGTCKSCQTCPPDCGNNKAPYCHCVGRGCGKRISGLNDDGECAECAASEKALIQKVVQ
jgi:hypothetical protein